MNEKHLRAMRLANDKKNAAAKVGEAPTKAEVRYRRTEKKIRARALRHSERQHIAEELGEDRFRPVDEWAGMPAEFLHI